VKVPKDLTLLELDQVPQSLHQAHRMCRLWDGFAVQREQAPSPQKARTYREI
jgi:hypothetical protein